MTNPTCPQTGQPMFRDTRPMTIAYKARGRVALPTPPRHRPPVCGAFGRLMPSASRRCFRYSRRGVEF